MLPQILAYFISQTLNSPAACQAITTLVQNPNVSSQAIGISLQNLARLCRMEPRVFEKALELGIEGAIELGKHANERLLAREQSFSLRRFTKQDFHQDLPPNTLGTLQASTSDYLDDFLTSTSAYPDELLRSLGKKT